MRAPRSLVLGSLAALPLTMAAPAYAAQVATIVAGKDNTLFSTRGETSNGAGWSVFSGRTGQQGGGIRQRALLWFDVAGQVPAGSTIESASLTLILVAAGPAGPQVHGLHRVSADWGEGESDGDGGTGAPSMPGDATWLHRFFDDVFWAAEGGDFDGAARASIIVGQAQGPYTWSTPALASDVQQWLDDPAANFGWILLGNEAGFNTSRKFGSRDAREPELHPVLTVEFTPPCAADVDGSGAVEVTDLTLLLRSWGACDGCAADLDGDGAVDVDDLIALLLAWGPCGPG